MKAAETTGRVLRVDRGACDVLTPEGVVRAAWRATDAADPSDPTSPCVGDDVALNLGPPVVVGDILPRRGTISRASVSPGSSERQPLVTNVDVAAICEPCHPEPNLARVERMLAIVWESGAMPAIVLTKCDLARDLDAVVGEVAPVGLGVPLLTVSTPTGIGVTDVRALITPGQVLALLGRSGAGKSTLLNALTGHDDMSTRELRADGKGRHTTTHRQMFQLDDGGFVVDTPGLKTVGLASDEALDQVFADVEDLAIECRFHDCSHTVEPGCEVLDAVASGALAQRRLDSYRKLLREAAYQARRADARLAAAERAKWKSIHKQHRRSSRPRP